ncbi:MAG: hypothetical protein WBG32_06930 [Nodosilinea sp.]
MTTSNKAKRATVAIGPLSVEGFQMPDGSYRISQTQAGESVGLSERSARDFLQSKGFKGLMGGGYTPAISEAKPDDLREQRSRLEQQLHDAGLEPWQLPPTER